MKDIRILCLSLTVLLLSIHPHSAYAAETISWNTAYKEFILDGNYLSQEDPAFYTETQELIRFGLYDLDKDGFPELIAYNGCEYMAGAANYVYTCKDGQVSYIGDAGFRGSVLRYYPTSDFPGLFCSDGNNGIIMTVYYEYKNGQLVQETVMEEDYNTMNPEGDPQLKQVTENTDLYTVPLTLSPVTLDMFTVAEIRDMGWKNLLARYPFVRSGASGITAVPEPANAAAGTAGGAVSAGDVSVSPFYGIWCGASKSYDDLQSEANALTGQGLSAQIFVTTDWSNLNPEFWYVLSAGTYASEEAAYSSLPLVQAVCPDAYVKYSGEYIGK